MACERSQTSFNRNEAPSTINKEVAAPAPTTLPERITLTDKLGRTLDVKIIGRDTDEISFIRLSDNKPFQWKITQLSTTDQEIIGKLPMIAGPSTSFATVDKHLYVENRKKEIVRINSEIELLEKELPSMMENATKGISPRVKGVERQIATKKEIVAKMEAEIENFGR